MRRKTCEMAESIRSTSSLYLGFGVWDKMGQGPAAIHSRADAKSAWAGHGLAFMGRV